MTKYSHAHHSFIICAHHCIVLVYHRLSNVSVMSLYRIMLPGSIYLCSRVLGTSQLCYCWNILFPSHLADLELARVTSEILCSILDLFALTPLPPLVSL